MKKVLHLFVAILAMFVSVGNLSATLETTTLGPTTDYGFLEGPNGSEWTYILNLHAENGFFDYMKVEIYDENNKLVSTIVDSLNVEGALGVRNVLVQPYLTKRFFNTSTTDYEVMVFVYANTKDYKGKYVHNIYSLSGEQAEKLYTIDGTFHMLENLSVNSYAEEYAMIFRREERTENDALFYHFDVYTRATYQSDYKVAKQHTFTVDYKNIASSGEEPSPIFLVNNNGKPNYVLAQYEKPYFFYPDNINEDIVVNENNSLIIKYYDDKFNLAYETKIPVELTLEYLYSFPHLGSLGEAGDVLVNYNGDGAPAYLITTKNYKVSSDSNIASYKLYDVNGNKLKDIADKVISAQKMSNIVGQSEQWMFARESGEHGVFTFVDFPSCEVVTELPVVTKDEIVLSSSIDRYGKEDTYQYVVALLQGEMAKDGSTQHKIAWFNKDGSFDHFDVLNLGTGVENAMFNITADALNPYLFDTDEVREYMVLLTKSKKNSSVKEKVLAICNTEGEILTEIGPDATKGGDLGMICLLNLKSHPMLMCPYSDGRTITLQYTELPLNNVEMEGEGTLENPYKITKAYDFTQIENNLTACYEVVNDIDFQNVVFGGINGEFTGKLNGGNFEIKNIVLDGCGMFRMVMDSAVIENMVLVNPILSVSKFSDVVGILVNEMVGNFTEAGDGFGGKISNIHVINPYIFDIDGFSGRLGGIAGSVSFYTTVEGCSMMGANINLPKAGVVGGVVGEISTTSLVSACAFDGIIEGGAKVGGIVAYSDAGDKIVNCHVVADLFGTETIGGIVGESARSKVENCYVEGNIEIVGEVKTVKVGGIIGAMGSTTSDSVYALVANNIVALDAIKLPAADELYAHRIVGYSNGDSFEYDWDKINYNKPQSEWPKIYNETEKCLKDNYALSGLDVIDAKVQAENTTTEGADLDASDLTLEWLQTHSFAFGDNVDSPWEYVDANLALWFEKDIKGPNTALDNVIDNNVVKFEGDYLIAEGNIYLFNVNGQLMMYGVDKMNISGMPAGVYVVRCADTAVKVILK